MALKIGFVSLGCSKNRMDTEVMLHRLLEAGYEITPEDTEADIMIINTCAFIESAKQEAIDNILDIAWLKENRKLRGIIVCGCLAERYGEEVLREMPEVDALIGVGSTDEIVNAVKSVEKGERGFVSINDKNKSPLGGDRILTTPEYTSYIKIAEGCDNRCTYCAIPDIRGKFRSRPIEELVAEAKELDMLGVRELCVIAQDTTRYGLDLYGRYELPRLLKSISENTKNIKWIRLLYCYPDKITDELVKYMRDDPKIVKYIDLPIQHISDRVLKKMNRHGGSDCIKDAVKKLRDAMPNIVIRTTAIVGFPGETEEEFTKLCEYVRETKFDRFGAFTYSQEEGTPAAAFDGQIDEQVKQDRYDIIMREQLAVTEEKCAEQIGREFDILCEGYDEVSEMHYGRSASDAPEIDGKVYFTAKNRITPGSFIRVRITETLDYDLIGRALC